MSSLKNISPRKIILVADDEESLRTLIHTTLDNPEWRILLTGDGMEALALARQELPDLAILDWMMPGLTGLEVSRELRVEPRTAGIPVLFLTARSQAQDMAQGLESGAVAFLTKPFSPLQLLEEVRRVLNARPATEENHGSLAKLGAPLRVAQKA